MQERDRQAKPGAARALNFFDHVSPDSVDTMISVLDHWRRRDPGEPVEIVFNSPGGSAVEGFALFDSIRRLQREGSHVTTRGTGVCASMGAVLLQAGDTRIMDENALMMIHKVSGQVKGTMEEMSDSMVAINLLQERALKALAARSTLSEDEIESRWLRKDWYLSAQQALDAGFVDVVE